MIARFAKTAGILIICSTIVSACGKKGLPGQDKDLLEVPIGQQAQSQQAPQTTKSDTGFVLDPLIK